MPTSRSEPDVLVDASVAVALCVGDHEHHSPVLEALDGRRLGLSGHAAFESFSVLTRLPPPARRGPAVVARLLAANFPESRFLSPQRAAVVVDRLAAAGVAGGAVYDALVGEVAAEVGAPLATLDLRAMDTYRAVGADVRMIATGAGDGS